MKENEHLKLPEKKLTRALEDIHKLTYLPSFLKVFLTLRTHTHIYIHTSSTNQFSKFCRSSITISERFSA